MANADTRSMAATTTVANINGESLFIRLKKRSKITKVQLSAETREGETLLENCMFEAMHDILEDAELDALLDDCHKASTGLYATAVTNQPKPKREILAGSKAAMVEEYASEDEDLD